MRIFLTLLLLLYAQAAFCIGGHGGTLSSPAITLGVKWNGFGLQGPYTAIPGIVTYLVDKPNGNTPSYPSDIESLQYHHHTKSAVDSGGRVWVAYSGYLTGDENESGLMTEVNSDAAGDAWVHPYGPQQVVLPATMQASNSPGYRQSYPRSFVSYNGNLYLVSAIDARANGGGGGSDQVGLALIATALNTDGSLGISILLNPPGYTYTPVGGFPNYSYDNTLSPPIYASAALYGEWGGSAASQTQSPWIGYAPNNINGGNTYTEMATLNPSGDGKTIYRYWRCVPTSCNGAFMYFNRSLDGGVTWSQLTITNIPNSPSAVTGMTLTDGRVALVANPVDGDGGADTVSARDPLFLAIINPATGNATTIYGVAQGIGGSFPLTPDNGIRCQGPTLYCGAAYAGVWETNNTLYISYSFGKEYIYLSVIPNVSGL